MPELSFSVEDAQPVAYTAAPLLALKLRIRNSEPEERIESVILQAQVRIEAAHRQYTAEEQSRLLDLFGEPERWGQTLRTMLWTHASVTVPPFSGEVEVELPLPCTFDFNVAATKYFDALTHGSIPLCLLFSGTVFYRDEDGALQAGRIGWNQEAAFSLPVETWKRVIDCHYPNTAWLTLRRDVFDRLHEYKRQQGIPTWEQTMEKLLP